METPEKKARYTSHPCGATGIASITLVVSEAELHAYNNLITASSGTGFELVGADDESGCIQVIVKAPETEEEKAFLDEFGVGVFGFEVKTANGTETRRLEGEGLRIILKP